MDMVDFWCSKNGFGSKSVIIKIPSECCGNIVIPLGGDPKYPSSFVKDIYGRMQYCKTHMSTYTSIWNLWSKNRVIDSPIDMTNIPFMLFRIIDPKGNLNIIKIPQKCCGVKIEKSINNNFSQQEKILDPCEHFMNIEDIWDLYGHTAMLKDRNCIKCNSVTKAIPNQPNDNFICYNCFVG
jgi:hypothetical protein